METLRNEIKKMSENQKFLKNQRKTVCLVGDRVIEPWKAIYTHSSNRHELRLMYAALGVMRGKTFNQIENHYENDNHPLNEYIKSIELIIKKYEETVCVSE